MVTLREQMDGEKSAGHSKANYQPGALLCTVDPVIDCEALFLSVNKGGTTAFSSFAAEKPFLIILQRMENV